MMTNMRRSSHIMRSSISSSSRMMMGPSYGNSGALLPMKVPSSHLTQATKVPSTMSWLNGRMGKLPLNPWQSLLQM